jgi:hypothetical protein
MGASGMTYLLRPVARKDIVLNQQNMRWECEAHIPDGEYALRKLSLV